MSKPDKQRPRLWGVSVGAGLLGAVILAVRYATRKPTETRVPDTISPAIFATRVLTTTVGDVIYHESGRGMPLIFLHGIHVGACSYEWSRVYPAFADRYHVMALDMIGFGESERPHKQFSAGDFVQSLAEFIQGKCGDQSAVIVASGLSGALAVQLAGQHPELVSRLILLMPTGMRDGGRQQIPLRLGWLSRIPVMNRLYYRNYLSAKASIRLWLEKAGFADPTLVDDETVEVYATCAQQYGAEHAIFNFLRRQFNVDLDKRLADCPHPVTLVWSDSVSSPDTAQGYHLQKIKPNTALIMLSHTGVLPALEVSLLMRSTLADILNPEPHPV